MGWIGTVSGTVLCCFIFLKVIILNLFISHTYLIHASSTQAWSTWFETMNDYSCMSENKVSQKWCEIGMWSKLTHIFGCNGGNRVIFCKTLANIVSYVISNNEYSVLFHFEINQSLVNFGFCIFDWVNRDSGLAMQNPLLGSDFHHCIFPKCPMNKNNKMNHHNYDYNY